MKVFLAVMMLCGVNVAVGEDCVSAQDYICKVLPQSFPSGLSSIVLLVSNMGELNDSMFSSETLESVTSLTITNAGVTAVSPGTFRMFCQLKHLSLYQNNVSEISSSWFCDPPQLETLILSRNIIETVDRQALRGLTGLRTLNLSQNRIRTIAVDGFLSQRSLAHLDLTRNRLTRISPKTFDPPRPTLVRLHDNPWDCSCAAYDFVRLLKGMMNASLLENEMEVTCETPPSLRGQVVWNVSECVPPTVFDPPDVVVPSHTMVFIIIGLLGVFCVLLCVICLLTVLYKRKRKIKKVKPATKRPGEGNILEQKGTQIQPESLSHFGGGTQGAQLQKSSGVRGRAQSAGPVLSTKTPLSKPSPALSTDTPYHLTPMLSTDTPYHLTPMLSTDTPYHLTPMLSTDTPYHLTPMLSTDTPYHLTPMLSTDTPYHLTPMLSTDTPYHLTPMLSTDTPCHLSPVLLTDTLSRSSTGLERQESPGRAELQTAEKESRIATHVSEHERSEEQDAGAQCLGSQPTHVTENLPYLSIGNTPANQNPECLDDHHHGDNKGPGPGRSIRRISTWPPTAVQWKASYTRDREVFSPFLPTPAHRGKVTCDQEERLDSPAWEDVSSDGTPRNGTDGIPPEVDTEFYIEEGCGCEPATTSLGGDIVLEGLTVESCVEIHTHSDQIGPGNSQFQDENCAQSDGDEPDGESLVHDGEWGGERRIQVAEVVEQEGDHGCSSGAGSPAPPGGDSLHHENPVQDNEYDFIDLLHEVVENQGRWTRDRWKKSHLNRQRSKNQGHAH